MSEDASSELTLSHDDRFFLPIIHLPPATIFNAEENETCVLKRKAKLYRYDRAEDPPEWKERGSGFIKILIHLQTGQYRLLMRRDKTFKVCANHVITSTMELRSNCNSDRAFVWQTLADFADEIPKSESLGIRFANADDAAAFKQSFDEGKKQAVQKQSKCQTSTNGDSTTSQVNQGVIKGEPDVDINLTNCMHKLHMHGEIINQDPAEDPPLASLDGVVGTV
ncbi:RAN binding protein 1 [Paragonimus heterotremus]|uniref:Ran-specific GTPase-activating protein n=1 Tax=Paragonimus heterotremus TaxID=100268 RepID=A0A8J4SMD4_9TREM|nr:RAN binding protein 1 [Paragonimus heterotremus]